MFTDTDEVAWSFIDVDEIGWSFSKANEIVSSFDADEIGWSLAEISGFIAVASKGFIPAFRNPALIVSG